MYMKKNKDISVLAANLSGVHMEINGNREIILEGSRGVVEYGENSIKDCDIVIHGFITSIEYIM